MRINRLILTGFFLVLAGAVLPFMIVLGILPSTFTMNFLAFGSSVVGVFLGVIGAAMYVNEKRSQAPDDERYYDS